MQNEVMRKAVEIEDYVLSFRRDLHAHPELSGEEVETQKKIIRELEKLGIPYRKAGSTSIIATLTGGRKGKTVALRGDIDALPIVEEADVPFRSIMEGKMHACGHDAHAAMLLGAARILSEMKEELTGEVRFFFQEGEETFTGAKKIIEAGGMDGVDACFGMHGMPSLPTGQVDITPGYRMAGCDTIYVKLEGVSGHSSMPHLARDTIHPACVFVTGLQDIITKNLNAQDPVVLSVGKFMGGTKANIISKYTELEISMRYFSPEARKRVHEGIRRHAKAIGEAYEVKVDVEIEESALSLYNEEEVTKIASESAEKVFGKQNIITTPRLMGSEDMPFYFQYTKGVYAFLGYRNEEKEAIYFPHHEKFKIDEDYMKYGVALHVQFALDFLRS
ncbi:amidohydrolase [Proteiniclasticum sp. SCR006]|uniref:Amidohydrolase n=1 Tax=Proteiniclasticum aestuarii TaxID=2817862 RepID=A0A939HF24_9CLOT|nr:amidohydrolase [Proteiniclasticum aestuarii]MBO1266360.1 amidohydrolase [Proteiniclasticum aestuarii]